MMGSDPWPAVLRPFNKAEAMSTAEAAAITGKTETTIRNWASQHYIGRKISGRVAISKVALRMHLEGDEAAKTAYLEGDRSSPLVMRYFDECGVPVPGLALAVS